MNNTNLENSGVKNYNFRMCTVKKNGITHFDLEEYLKNFGAGFDYMKGKFLVQLLTYLNRKNKRCDLSKVLRNINADSLTLKNRFNDDEKGRKIYSLYYKLHQILFLKLAIN